MNATTVRQFPDRPLPLGIRPYPDELTRSFIGRIETANAIRPGFLLKTLRGSRKPWMETLAVWTGQPPMTLCLAMPQLCRNDVSVPRARLAGRPNRTTHTFACRHCAVERTETTQVEIYTTHDRVICPRHGLWLGEGIKTPTQQLSIKTSPEILTAWHHHKNLITRFGRSRVRKAFHDAGMITWRWYEQFNHFTAATDTYDNLTADQPRHANSHAITTASLYPSTVTLTAVIASPYWARIAHSREPKRFLERISTEITEGWTPAGASDPLRHWMTEDWSPGVLGPDTISPMPNQHPRARTPRQRP